MQHIYHLNQYSPYTSPKDILGYGIIYYQTIGDSPVTIKISGQLHYHYDEISINPR